MNEAIVQMRKVRKRFGDIQALDNVDLDIYPGRIIGLGGGERVRQEHAVAAYYWVVPCG